MNSDPNAPGGTPVMQQSAPVRTSYSITCLNKTEQFYK
jgi:hypothetical protein